MKKYSGGGVDPLVSLVSHRAWRRWMGTEIVDIGRMCWQPPVDLYETEDGAIVRIEAAGLREGDYAVQARGETLVIAGTRRGMNARRPLACHRLEIASGGFQVDVRLPWPAAVEGVDVSYDAGIITVLVPRADA